LKFIDAIIEKEYRILSVLVPGCGILSAAAGAAALLGWAADLPLLASFGADRIPMAPSTALFFMLYGATTISIARFPASRTVARAGIFVGSGGALLSLLLFILAVRGIQPDAEYLGLRVVAGAVQGAPVGHMSPVTAFSFLLAGLSFVALLTSAPVRLWGITLAGGLAFVVILISLVLLKGYFLGMPFFYGSGVIPPALSTSLAFLALGVAQLLSAVQRSRPDEKPSDVKTVRVLYLFVMIFIFLATGIITIGALYSRSYEEKQRAEVEHQLAAIADLKAAELVQWRKERLSDAAVFNRNPYFFGMVLRYFEDPGNSDARKRLQTWMRKIREAHQYVRVCLHDIEGRLRLADEDNQEPETVRLSPRDFEAWGSGQILFEDFYRDEQTQQIQLNILAPIIPEGGHPGRVIGILALHIDPEAYLYPLVKRWPTPSPTAETLIVRREGNDVLFLNELRFKKDSALNLRIPLGRGETPAVQAVLGHEGIVQGRDYRGVPVIAAVRGIPGSPWFLVARMDIAEVYAPVREQRWLVLGLVGALLLSSAFGVGLVWRQQRLVFYKEKSKAAEALRESEAFIKVVLDNLPVGIAVNSVDPAVIFSYMNDNFPRFYRTTREKLTEPDAFWDVAYEDPEFREGIKKRVLADVASGDPKRMFWEDVPITRHGEAPSYVTARNIIIPDRPLMISTVWDVTERKEAQEEIIILNRRLHHLISAIQELSSARTLEGVQRIVAASARKLTGADGATMVFREGDCCYYADEDAIGPLWKGKRFPLSSCISGWVMLHNTPAIIADIYADERIPQEAYRPTFVRSLAMIPVNTTEPVAAIGTYWRTNYTPAPIEIQLLQTLADAAARAVENVRLLEELEERVRERTAQLEAANKELEAFSYSVSHDLRAPLRAVDGYTHILLEDFAPHLDAEGKRVCGVISESARAMGRLIDDLLSFSRVGRASLQLSTIDMTTMARSIFHEATTPEERERIDFRVGTLPMVFGDPKLMRQVWMNLLANGVKFSAKKAQPVIEVGAEERENEILYFVRDNGAGFDMQYADKLFGVFQRLHSTKEFEGTGVGLAIAQRIILRHGGRIWAEGEPGIGATFYFTLS
jgi:hypothetical protein